MTEIKGIFINKHEDAKTLMMIINKVTYSFNGPFETHGFMPV